MFCGPQGLKSRLPTSDLAFFDLACLSNILYDSLALAAHVTYLAFTNVCEVSATRQLRVRRSETEAFLLF